MEQKSIQDLIDKHWAYVEDILKTHGAGEQELELSGKHYKTAFLHGFKHGYEAKLDEYNWK
jgi:hypothetical protein